MIPVRILLTFDDGPHDGTPNGSNHTEKVLHSLRCRRVKAVFFIQTHAPERLPSCGGFRAASQAHSEGHVLAVHTGSFVDHRCHKWRCTQPTDVAGASNGLDADMIRAKYAIKGIVGAYPRFVRATYGYTNADCMKVYSQNNLKHVYWDVVSGDDSKTASAESVRTRLFTDTRKLAQGPGDLIYLMHDVNKVTADNAIEFIDTIASAVRANGLMPMFVGDRIEAEFVMDRKSRQGSDTPCPPDSMD